MTAPRPKAARALGPGLSSETYRDDEPVFGIGHHLVDGIASPVFGDLLEWPGECIGRPANRTPAEWKFTLPDDEVMNLRLREFAFSLLNPTHPALRRAQVFRQAEPTPFSTVNAYAGALHQMMRWGRQQHLPDDLGLWERADWDDYLAHRVTVAPANSSVGNHVSTIRLLGQLAPVMTGVTPFEDLWPGQSAAQVARGLTGQPRAAEELATPSIPPQTWWPMIRAAWTYIHTFAPDLLRWRDHFAREDAERDSRPWPGKHCLAPAVAEQMVAAWLAAPSHLVPVRAKAVGAMPAGSPIWATLSLAISAGANKDLFGSSTTPEVSASVKARRDAVLAAVAAGQVQLVRHNQGRHAVQAPVHAPLRQNARTGRIDADLREWLADPRNAVPVRAEDDRHGRAGTPIYRALTRVIWGDHSKENFSEGNASGRERRRLVQEVAARGRVVVVSGISWTAIPLPCPDAAQIDCPDGTRQPWRQHITRDELAFELRMLRASCYVFVAALSLMRDSEVQEIQRDAMVTHFGSPAVVSRKVKMDPSRPELRWWVIEPVAEAIAVAEQLSWHPTHIFATMKARRSATRGRHGIGAAEDIDFFIAHVNATGHLRGLDAIGDAHVRPHMFRKTMSQLTAREPDSEIALGLQLKHAARRALSNQVTQAYGKMDTTWAKEFDQDLEAAAAQKLVALLKVRSRGERVAVGPGAARLHTGLDNVLAKLGDGDTHLRAHLADERTAATLLASEFPDLHLGTLNHCMFAAPQAECQNDLPEEQRGQAPVVGACQPSRCRNSVITPAHAPIWIAEEDDLTALARDPSLAPPRREAVLIRLEDVQRITHALRDAEGGD